MARFSDLALMVTGIGHALLGVVLFRRPLAAILGKGVVNTIPEGQLVNHAVARRDRWLFAVVGWNLGTIGVVGASIMPASGFWISIAIAPFVFKAARGVYAHAEVIPRVSERSV